MTEAFPTAVRGFHPAHRLYRFAVLGIASTMLFGSYFAYDSVGAIETTLMKAWNVDRAAIGAMYTMYSVAAIFTVVLGGILIDRIGTRRASLLFSALVTLGAALVAGAPNLSVLYAGRLVFGMGSESLVIAQCAILARWFTGKELALSFGIALTVSRLGTLFAFNTEALLDQRYGFRAALWVAAGLCALSLGGNLAYNLLDRKAEAALGLKESGAQDKIVWKDVARFDARYWLVTLLCVTFYSAIFPFTALSTDLFHEKWGLPNATGEGGGFLAGVLHNLTHMFSTAQGTTSIIITASMFFAPFAGRLVDRAGRRASLMIVGSLLMIPAHLLLGLTMLTPVLSMLVLGAAFVLVPAALWPAVPLIVEKERVGTAFGLMATMQNVGLALFPLWNGYLRDATHGYEASQIMFAALGVVGLGSAIVLKRFDARTGRTLESR